MSSKENLLDAVDTQKLLVLNVRLNATNHIPEMLVTTAVGL